MQGENSLFTLVRCENDSEWLEERRKGIGGSDVAAIMGLNPWRSPYEVWLDKTGRAVPEDISDQPSVHWGQVLEPVIGREYKDLHPERKVSRVNAVCRSISRPWAQASLDFEVHDPELGWGVLEIKTAGLRSARSWEDGVPVWYQTQVAHYLSVTGRGFADVAVLIGGQDYREYRILRDEDDISAVDAAVDRFWTRCVVGGEEPDFTGNGSEVRAALQQHSDPSDDFIDATPELETMIDRYLKARDMADEYDRVADELAVRLKEASLDHKGIGTPMGTLVWVRSESSRFDTKRFRKEHPELAEEYSVTQPRDGGLRWKPAI